MLSELNLDKKNFKEIVDEARGYIPELYPEWTDYNTHDTGIALIELFAWFKEIQQYHMDRLTPLHREKYLRILGLSRRQAVPAACEMAIMSGDGYTVPQSMKFYAGEICYENEKETTVPGGRLKGMVCDSLSSECLVIFEDEISYDRRMQCCPFGQKPSVGTAFDICFSQPLLPEKEYRISFRLNRIYDVHRNPFTGPMEEELVSMAVCSLGESGYAEADLCEDETHGLLTDGGMTVRIKSEMVCEERNGIEGYWLRFRLQDGEYDIVPVITGIAANVIRLIQIDDVYHDGEGHNIHRFTANGFPDQSFSLARKMLLAEHAVVCVEKTGEPGVTEQWENVPAIETHGPEDKVCHIDTLNGMLLFGDGYHGMIPEGDITVEGLYYTLGFEGNVRGRMIDTAPSIASEIEFAAAGDARGGKNEESFEECMESYLDSRKLPYRAVTEEDYERLISNTPGLCIHSCKVLKSEDENISVVVRPYYENRLAKLSPAYRKNILAWLEDRRLLGSNIRLLSPEYVNINVYVEFYSQSRFYDAEKMIRNKIKEYFKTFDGSFGRTILSGELYGILDSMPVISELRSMNIDAMSNRVFRTANGDLYLPANGVIILKDIKCILIET